MAAEPSPQSRQNESAVSEEAARDLAHALTLYVATEHNIIAHRNDDDPTELQELAARWVALAVVINQRRRRLETAILAAPVGRTEGASRGGAS